jgi:hypothetical protein
MKMMSMFVFIKGDLLGRGCETRSHRTMEGRGKYIGKVGVMLKGPYASKELTWRGIVR